MESIKYFLDLLEQPFPDYDNRLSEYKSLFFVGAFITLFLYLLQPFGLTEFGGNLFIVCCGFGLVTFLVGVLLNFILIDLLKIRKDEPSWTLKRWIIFVIILLLCIAIANYLYIMLYLGFFEFSFSHFLVMCANTLLVGIFPVVFSGLFHQISSLRKNKNSASEINERLVQNSNPTEQIILSSANEKQKLTFQNDEILYLEAMQNYTAIIFIRDDKLQKEMIRNTFSAIEKQLFETSIIRCHRSYFINLNQIDKIEGNAQCLNIFLKEQDDLTVPVSKKYMKAFSSKIK